MDTDRLVELVTTPLIVAMLGYLVAPTFDIAGFEDRFAVAAGVGIAVGIPIALVAVFVLDEESHFFGPWDVGDLVFLLVAIPGVAGTVWVADRVDSGLAYWAVVAIGVVGTVVVAVIVRDATVGEWPPGSGRPANGEQGPPGP